MALRRSLTTLTLVFVMYFNISGGAFTIEGLVAGVGPGMGVAGAVGAGGAWTTSRITSD